VLARTKSCNPGLVVLRDPPTAFVEWPPVVVKGGEALGVLAKALPSEGGEEHPGRDERRPTCAWGSPVVTRGVT
jgi:hypothetical protein